jgi:predicted transcriptional regulator of viral defense system
VNFQAFQQAFSDYPVFSQQEIRMRFPGFDSKNLVNWQAKNYLLKIRNAWYAFPSQSKEPDALFFISNQIYQPSYISLETALSHYGFIPEGVFRTTAVSTLKTQKFQTPLGLFTYQNIKPSLNFGFRLEPFGKYFYKLATPEKAILDYFYLHPELVSESDFEGLRLNLIEIRRSVDFQVFQHLLDSFQSKALSNRAKIFTHFIENQ